MTNDTAILDAQREKVRMQRLRYRRRMHRRRTFTLPPDLELTVQGWLRRPSGRPLETYAERVLSQHGEDGITVEVFRRIGVEYATAVEIGCGANGGNAGILVAGLGMRGLFLDGSKQLVQICRARYEGLSVDVQRRWIERDTVTRLLHKAGMDSDLDYLGIDLDGIDYWIWEALAVRPRLLIVEYNNAFGPDLAVTVPYARDFSRKAVDDVGQKRHPKGFWGASLAAFARLSEQRGYRLVATAPASTNAYFVREDTARDLPAVSVVEAWRGHTKGQAHQGKKNARWLKGYRTIQERGVVRYFAEQGAELVEVG